MKTLCIVKAYLYANDSKNASIINPNSFGSVYRYIFAKYMRLDMLTTDCQTQTIVTGQYAICNRYYIDTGGYAQRQRTHSISISLVQNMRRSPTCLHRSTLFANCMRVLRMEKGRHRKYILHIFPAICTCDTRKPTSHRR